MGYYIQITSSDCRLPKAKADEAYRIMCQLNWDNSNKRGGRYSGLNKKNDIPNDVPHPDRWFSWMKWNYHETCKNAHEILSELGFELDQDENYIFITGYNSKAGQEDLFLNSIAHLLEGSIEWSGEDDTFWKNTFTSNEMKTLEGKIVYE